MNAMANTGTDRVREAPTAAVTSSPRWSALPPCPVHHITVGGGAPQNLLSGAQSTLPPPTTPIAWRVKETSSPPIFWDEYCLFPLPHQQQGQHLPTKCQVTLPDLHRMNMRHSHPRFPDTENEDTEDEGRRSHRSRWNGAEGSPRGEREAGAPSRERRVQTRRLGFLQPCLPSPPRLGTRDGPVVSHARALAAPGASRLLSPPAPQTDPKHGTVSAFLTLWSGRRSR